MFKVKEFKIWVFSKKVAKTMGKNVDVASMNLNPPHPNPLPKGEREEFPLPSGERTKVRGKRILLKTCSSQITIGHLLT